MAKQPMVEVWGSGAARREFLHVDDMAAACLHVMRLSQESYAKHTEPMLSHINVGTGQDVTIKDLAQMIIEVVGYQGEISWNTAMPDGTPRKLLDVQRLSALGWRAEVELRHGLADTYQWFVENYDTIRGNS